MLHFFKDWWKFIQIYQYGFNATNAQINALPQIQTKENERKLYKNLYGPVLESD